MVTAIYVIIALTCAVAIVSFVTLVVVLHNISKSQRKAAPQVADVPSEENTETTTEEENEESVAEESEPICEDSEPCEEETAPVCQDENASDDEQTEAAQEERIEQDEVAADGKPDADVAFSTDKLTLEQKYLKLPYDKRAYYDEIVRYAMAVDGNKRYKNATYEEYKVGKSRLVRIKIKNDAIVCELIVPNLDFKNYISNNKIEVRQASTVIKVDDQASLDAVKGCMDVALQQIEKERQYKKEQALLRRRQKRAEKKNETANASND